MVSTEVPNEVRPRPGEEPVRTPKRAWWFGFLTFVVLAWLAMFVLPTYLTLDPAKSVIPLNPGFSLHYPVLIVHVGSGMIAMLAGCLQVWPWLRRNHSTVHRISGRVYVFAVLLGAPALATLIVLRAQEPGDAPTSTVLGFAMLEILWVAITIAGYLRGRQRRFADHRRLMIYSFAMTLSIMWSRFAFVVTFAIPEANDAWVVDNVGWFPWVLNLVVAQWWLNRTARRPLVLPASVASVASVASRAATPS